MCDDYELTYTELIHTVSHLSASVYRLWSWSRSSAGAWIATAATAWWSAAWASGWAAIGHGAGCFKLDRTIHTQSLVSIFNFRYIYLVHRILPDPSPKFDCYAYYQTCIVVSSYFKFSNR